MTMTQNGQAIILGGIDSQGVLANLTTAYVLDTQASHAQWQRVPLKGRPPDPRMAFSAVVVNATTLLVYGGTPDFRAAYWVVFYLDLPTWTWSTPEVQGTSPRRWGHTATMAGSTMVVAFGKQDMAHQYFALAFHDGGVGSEVTKTLQGPCGVSVCCLRERALPIWVGVGDRETGERREGDQGTRE